MTTRTCEACGKSLSGKRRNAKTCSNACRQAAHRERQEAKRRDEARPPERRPLPRPKRRLIDPRDWHPRTPAIATLALSKGIQLRWQNLDPLERDLLSAASSPEDCRPDKYRAAAARRLLAAHPRLQRGETTYSDEDRVMAVLIAARIMRERFLTDFSKGDGGRPKHVEPWRPWEWDWGLSLQAELPRFYRKALDLLAPQVATDDPSNSALRLAALESAGAQVYRDEWGEVVAFRDPHVPVGHRTRFWQVPKQSLRTGTAKGASSSYREALDQRERMKMQGKPLHANPDLRDGDLLGLKGDLAHVEKGMPAQAMRAEAPGDDALTERLNKQHRKEWTAAWYESRTEATPDSPEGWGAAKEEREEEWAYEPPAGVGARCSTCRAFVTSPAVLHHHDCATYLRRRLRWREGDDPVEYMNTLAESMATFAGSLQRHDERLARIEQGQEEIKVRLGEQYPNDVKIGAAVDQLIEDALGCKP